MKMMAQSTVPFKNQDLIVRMRSMGGPARVGSFLSPPPHAPRGDCEILESRNYSVYKPLQSNQSGWQRLLNQLNRYSRVHVLKPWKLGVYSEIESSSTNSKSGLSNVSPESGLYQTGFTGKWPLPNRFHGKVASAKLFSLESSFFLNSFHWKVATTKPVSLESGLYQTGITGKWPLPNRNHRKVASTKPVSPESGLFRTGFTNSRLVWWKVQFF